MTLNSRKNVYKDTTYYSTEIEFQNCVTYAHIRGVLGQFANEVGYADHNVVGVTDLESHRGVIMAKVDGMKVYAFCYASGSVITQTDNPHCLSFTYSRFRMSAPR